jgi:hypothetical protein
MSLRTVSLLALAALVFVAGFVAIVRTSQDKPPAKAAPAAQPIVGKIDFREIDDLRVAGRKVILCGVAYTKPAAMRDMVKQAARQEFQGKSVTCRPVGSGTPCDGRAATSFGGALVGQCLTEDQRDVAGELAAKGILCDVPAQSGGHYAAC